MKITEIAVKRPVTTVMFFIAMIIMGVISIVRTPREMLPSMSYPQVSVITRYEAATPDEIERQVTTVLEDAVGTVGRLQNLSSFSRDGLSLIIAEFMWGTDMNVASLEVREKIDLVKERLPRDSKEPIVIKYNPFELPVVTLILSLREGAGMGDDALYRMKQTAENIIKNNLEKVENVASVEIKGGREREILVEAEQPRLRATDISLLEVVQVLRDSNMTYPAGTIETGFYEYLVKTDGEFKSIDDIRTQPLKVAYFTEEEVQRMQRRRETPKGLVFLSDVATIKDTFKERRGLLRYNGREAIAIDIKRQSGSNVVRVAENIRRAVESVRDQLPDDYSLELVYDQSEYIEKSIQGISSSALMGSLLAFLVLFVFLRSFKNSVIVAAAIPVSLAITFIFIYFNNISLNMMSLGGLALGVGMLVDSSIVVLENIFRYNQENPGNSIMNAISGTQEVTGAIISSTLTTITVFFPFVFIAGVAGQLFKELAFTVTFSLIASLVVAVTLIPRMTSEVSSKKSEEPEWTGYMQDRYRSLLKKFLAKSGFYMGIISAVFIFSLFYILRVADHEFIPRMGGSQFVMNIELPFGTVLERTDRVVETIEGYLYDIEEVTDVISSIGAAEGDSEDAGSYSLMGTHQAEIVVSLKTKTARQMDAVIDSVRRRIERTIRDADIEYITQAGVLGGALSGDAPIALDVKGDDVREIINVADEVVKRLEEIPYLYGVKSSFRGYRKEFGVVVDRDRASLYNISAQNIALSAQTAIRGYVATTFKQDEEEIDIRVKLAGDRGGEGIDEGRIGRILIRSPLGYDVLLNQVASFSSDAVSPEILRKEGARTVSVTANYADISFAGAVRQVERIMDELQQKHPDTIIEMSGDRQQMQDSFTSLIFVIILSIVFVYMIMASQFESLWQPFIVIFTLPLSFIGVAMILFVTGTSLSIIALLGIIMLGGIVVNNGIVLISYYNVIEQKGEMGLDSLIEASTTRLRPVLMTAVTTVLGLIPMAIAGGEGAEFRAPLAITVIGGLIVSTFLTLFVVPAVYFFGKKFMSSVKFFIANAGF